LKVLVTECSFWNILLLLRLLLQVRLLRCLCRSPQASPTWM
jgi:hypothetical protein